MAALWADLPSGDVGLYDYNTGDMLDGIWAEVNTCALVDDPDPNIGSIGRCLQVGQHSVDGGNARFVLPGVRTVVGMTCRLWLANIPVSTERAPAPFVFCDGSNNIIINVTVSPTGSLLVRRDGRDGTLIAETSGPVLTANAWTHLSCKATFGTGGNCEISIEREGIPILTATGLDFEGTTCSQVRYQNYRSPTSAVTTAYVKDVFIWDGTGSVNNDHPGPVSVYRRPVNADVSSGWTRSSGTTDYELLDESPADDANYISADDTLPAPSIMELLDLPDEVVSVRAVCMVGRMKKTDGGDCKVQMSLTPNGTDWADGSDRALTTADTYWFDWSELSPDTGFPWTPIEFNGAEIKINRTL